jgi:hypothetical protein
MHSAAQQSFGPAFISHCVPAYAEGGDLNCDAIYAPGVTMIQLADPSNDPHGFDSWNSVADGWGCESDSYEPGRPGNILDLAKFTGEPVFIMR